MRSPLSTRIAQREDVQTMGTTLQVIQRVGDRLSTIVQRHPPDEDVKSAATLLRPILLLQTESIYWGKVMESIGYLSQNAPEMSKDEVRRVKGAWKVFDRLEHG